jgi:hypothetical protein
MERVSESLQVSLGMYHVDMLREMAEVLALKVASPSARKNWYVTELSKAIPKLARSTDFIRQLSGPEHALLALVAKAGGVATLRDVTRPLLLAGLVRIDGEPQTATQPEVKDLVLRLMRKGLLVNLANPRSGATMRSWAQNGRFGIAPEVREVLPLHLLVPPRPQAAAPWLNRETPPVVRERSLHQYMRRLFFVWAALRHQSGRQLKSGGLGKRDLRRLAQAVGFDEESELDRVNALYTMLVALNLVSGDGMQIVAVDNSASTLFWNATPARQMHDLARAYVRLDVQLPDAAKRVILPGFLDGYGHRDVSEVREEIYSAVTQMMPHGWVDFSFFVNYVNSGRPGVILLGDDTLLYLGDNLRWYGLNYRGDVEISVAKAETSLVHAALMELADIGFVDLGYATESNSTEAVESYPVALRVASVVRTQQEDRAAGDGISNQRWQVILQPDFQLLAMGPVPLRVLSNLQQVAVHEKLGESVIAYRVTRESAYQAFRRGETVDSMMGYLEEATQQPAPQNVRRSIEEWNQQYERIVLRRHVRLVQVDSAERLDHLLDDEKVRPLLHRLGECVAWVHPTDAARVEARLAELQLLVAHSKNSDEDLSDSLRWHDDELTARAPLPSLYVTGTLSRVAESRNGRWHVTAETVGNAASMGLGPVDIVDLLQRMTGAPLPAEWEKRIKAWGKHYGDGQISQVRLLRLNRSGALKELRSNDAELRRWLRPLPGSDILAVVSESNWDKAIAALASWGVDVEEGPWW